MPSRELGVKAEAMDHKDSFSATPVSWGCGHAAFPQSPRLCLLLINPKHYNASHVLLCCLMLILPSVLITAILSQGALHVLLLSTMMLLLLITGLLCFLPRAQQALT